MRVLSKSIVLGTAVAFSAMLATSALAQNHKVENNRNKHAQSQGDKPINKLCPISYEPIELDAGTFEYKGNAIAICCAGCDDKFLAWDEPRKDMFVKMALAGKESEMADHDAKAMKGGMKVASLWTEPYALNTCAVSGEELGAMDDVIVKTYDGREVRFCCEGCIEDFEAGLSTQDQDAFDTWRLRSANPAQLEWEEAKDTLKPFWQIPDNLFASAPTELTYYKFWKKQDALTQKIMRNHPDLTFLAGMEKAEQEVRLILRKQYDPIEQALNDYYPHILPLFARTQ